MCVRARDTSARPYHIVHNNIILYTPVPKPPYIMGLMAVVDRSGAVFYV